MAVVGVPRGARTRTGRRVRVEADQSQRRPLCSGARMGSHASSGRGWGATPPQGGDGGATPPRRPKSRDAVSVGWAGPSTSISPHAESSRSRSAGSTEQREPLHLLTPRPGFFLLSAAAENWGPEHHLFSSLEISVTNGALLQCVIPYPSKFDPVVNFGA